METGAWIVKQIDNEDMHIVFAHNRTEGKNV